MLPTAGDVARWRCCCGGGTHRAGGHPCGTGEPWLHGVRGHGGCGGGGRGELLVQCSPLSTPAVRVTVSGAPPYLTNAELRTDLQRYGVVVSPIVLLRLRTRIREMRHVLSGQRQQPRQQREQQQWEHQPQQQHEQQQQEQPPQQPPQQPPPRQEEQQQQQEQGGADSVLECGEERESRRPPLAPSVCRAAPRLRGAPLRRSRGGSGLPGFGIEPGEALAPDGAAGGGGEEETYADVGSDAEASEVSTELSLWSARGGQRPSCPG
ncbi:unnamed protein product [Lampetra fluviatilis]